MITLEKVCFAYEHEVALRYINLHIDRGDSVVIQGPNGCGRINPEGIWNTAKCLLITAIDALVAACLSPIPLNYIFSNLHSLGGVWSSIVSFLLSVVLVGGGVAFFVFLSSLSVGMAIAYVLIKFFLIGACRISVSYLAILVILIGWQNGVFLLSAGGVALLFTIGLMLGGIEMMIKGALG